MIQTWNDDYDLTWHLLLRGVQLEQIRGDRVHEAFAVRVDPLDLAAVFHLSPSTAIAHTDIARAMLERPIEAPHSADDARASAPDTNAVPRPGSLIEPDADIIISDRKASGSS